MARSVLRTFDPLPDPAEPAGRCQWSWTVVAQVVAAAVVSGAVFATITGFVVNSLVACKYSYGTQVRKDPSTVVIAAYPDTGCAYPDRGVAGVLQPVDEGRVLYISNCHNLHLLHTVDPVAGSVASTAIPSNLPSITTATDKLKFAAFDAISGKVYVSFLRHDDSSVGALDTNGAYRLPNSGCVSLSIAVCAFGAAPLGAAPSATCATLFDSESGDLACGAMNMHATGGQLMATATDLLFTVGDLLQEPSTAQDDTSFWGKIWRAPLGKEPLVRSDFTMVSKGNRNPQGLCPIDGTNLVLETEHGPMGGDEINVIDLDAASPANYGWPVVSYGDHYDGTIIPDTHAPRYTEPIAFFAYNLVGANGITVCTNWNGYHVIGSLNGHRLYTLVLGTDRKVARLDAVDMNYRIRSIAPLDDCAALLLAEPENGVQGPLIHVNVCGRNRLYGDPDHV